MIKNKVDLFKLVLMQSAEYTLLPELFDLLGADLTYRFLEQFSGLRLVVPDRGTVARAARDVQIYESLYHKREDVVRVAGRHSLSEDEVQRIGKIVHELQEGVLP